MKKPFKILLVDDSSAIRKQIIHLLSSRNISAKYLEASNGIDALKLLLSGKKADLIISDWLMPKLDGIKLLKTLRANPRFKDIPTILMTVKGKTNEKITGLEHGAIDYISKPFHADEFAIRVINFLKICEYQDVLRLQNKKLEKLASLDPLTKLPNRNFLYRALKQEWNRSQRFKTFMGCLMVDMDSFKEINDTYGHNAGDEVLKEFAKVITSVLRPYDFACRYGGDEFIIVLPETSKKGVQVVGERLIEKISTHCFLKKKRLNVTVSVGGYSIEGNKVKKPEEIIDIADQALYRAKKGGKNKLVVA
ncbi:MAG TPA: diguanylate cyclase [Nitrospiria bacterium]|nr:diguanylate cyclase [Nitrospiria bacterium]